MRQFMTGLKNYLSRSGEGKLWAIVEEERNKVTFYIVAECETYCDYGFSSTKRDDYYRVDFDHFGIEHCFLRQQGSNVKVARAENQTTISKFIFT